jgi:hypothetical protein
VADVAVVLLFALLGRVSHSEGDLLAGTLTTAAPFVIGLLGGWVGSSCAGVPSAQRAGTVRFGWWVLGCTVVGGLALRGLMGGGLDPAFLLVALGFLTAGLVGRRWLLLSRAR